MTETFARRDLVQLLSGGPRMTVADVTTTAGTSLESRGQLVKCTWFEGSKHREKSFFAELLTRAAPPPMPNETERDRA